MFAKTINWTVILRPAVSRPVYLGIKPPSVAYDQIFITVGRLRVCWYGAPSLTRERICILQLLLSSPAVILKSESRGAHDHNLLSQIWDSPNLEDQVPVFISPRNRVARLYPQALGLLTHCCPLAKAILNNDCRIFAYSAFVAYQRTLFIESLLSNGSTCHNMMAVLP
jgi:hypothetical protein